MIGTQEWLYYIENKQKHFQKNTESEEKDNNQKELEDERS